MPCKVVMELATLLVAVTFAAQHREDARDGGTSEWPMDVIGVILSFFGRMEWSQLGMVSPLWAAAIPSAIRHYLGSHDTPVDPAQEYSIVFCSPQYTIKKQLDTAMDKPGFRGAIFNKDECTLINHSLRGSQVCSKKGFDGRVRITGVAKIPDGATLYESKCNDYFPYRIGSKLRARNIHTGRDIKIGNINPYGKATMVNKNTVVVSEANHITISKLNWYTKSVKIVAQQKQKGNLAWRCKSKTNESGDLSSVLCVNDYGSFIFDIRSKKWKLIQEQSHSKDFTFSPDGEMIFITDKQNREFIIETTDEEPNRLLRIPNSSSINESPGPGSQFVGLSISSKYCMMNLRSGEMTVIPDIDPYLDIRWFSDTIFRMTCKDGRSSLRCAHDPCVDVVTLKRDDSMIQRLRVNDEQNARDLFDDLDRVGPKIIQNHPSGMDRQPSSVISFISIIYLLLIHHSHSPARSTPLVR